MDRDEFVEVIEPLPFDEADLRFARWLEANHLNRQAIRDEDIRIDIIRSLSGGSLKRYMVRRGAFGEQQESGGAR